MRYIGLWGITPADGTSLDFGQIEPDDTTKLILFRSSLHEPVTVDAQDMESVEAIVDAYKVDAIREGLR